MGWVLHIVWLEIVEWIDAVFAALPGRIGTHVRGLIVRGRVRSAGGGIRIGPGVEITGHRGIDLGRNVQLMKRTSLYAHDGGELRIGNDLFLNSNSCISASEGGKIVIGDGVLIGVNVIMRAAEHEIADATTPIRLQGHHRGIITIGDDCWICSNAVITSNVTIGSHSIVAAGAVVTSDVEPYSIVGGIPARLIRKRHVVEEPAAHDRALGQSAVLSGERQS